MLFLILKVIGAIVGVTVGVEEPDELEVGELLPQAVASQATAKTDISNKPV
jgi:hypothetical protein